jgi:hypothetical protein
MKNGATQSSTAVYTSKDRNTVSNRPRIYKLPPEPRFPRQSTMTMHSQVPGRPILPPSRIKMRLRYHCLKRRMRAHMATMAHVKTCKSVTCWKTSQVGYPAIPAYVMSLIGTTFGDRYCKTSSKIFSSSCQTGALKLGNI